MGRKQHQKRQIRRRTISQSTPDDIHAAKSNTTSSRLGQGVSSCQSQRPVDVSETRVRPRTATNQARQRTARSLAAIGSSENTLPHSSAHTGNQAMSAVSPGDFQWPQQNPSHVASHDPLSSHTQARQNHWPQGEPTRYALTIEGHDTPFEGIPVSTNRSFVHSSVIRNLSLHRYQFPTPPNSNFLLHEGTGYQYNPHDCLVVTLKTSERERIRLSIVVIDDSENTVRAAKNCIYLGPDFRNALNAQRHQQYPLPNSMPANLNPAGGMYQTTNPITCQ
ncbi:hypothetical protein F4778DRAFT_721741 [Xylariomycetidae sp. FL2044]|nr:hypothetical protein F4778DRAFT_721741 [Xylariomycetidae sp. FL2044]